MEQILFYFELGLTHVLDPQAYDHVLFLAALALPFQLKEFTKVVWLATAFTLAHCTSLALSVYKIIEIDSSIIEFLIPVTIAITAVFNILIEQSKAIQFPFRSHLLATLVFGLIHGFGFSNYFKMLMDSEPDKLMPLLGFTGGIEIAQLIVLTVVLLFTGLLFKAVPNWSKKVILAMSVLVILICIPMLVETFPL